MFNNTTYLVLRYTEIPPVFVRGFVILRFFSTYFTNTTIEPPLTATSLPWPFFWSRRTAVHELPLV